MYFEIHVKTKFGERTSLLVRFKVTQQQQQQQQQHLFKHDKNYSGADVVVYLRS